MKILYRIGYGLFAMLLVSIAVLFFAPASPFLGGIDVKIVKSGSMEPGIMTGGIVVIHESPSYVPGDVITFQSRGADIPTTHRIVSEQQEDGKTVFVTKGDANEEADTNPASLDSVIGKVLFTVPYAGFVLDFARRPLGFALLIVLPALLIVIDEVEKIWKEIRRRKKPRITRADIAPLVVAPFVPAPRVLMMDINRPAFLHTGRTQEKVFDSQIQKRTSSFEPSWVMATSVVLVVATFMVNMWSIGGTVSYFNDTETATQNMLGAGTLDFTATPADATFAFIDGVLDNPDGLITLVAPQVESAEMKYSLSVEFISGNQVFCNAIQVNASAPVSYMGALPALNATNVAFSTSWTLGMSLASGSYLPGDICVVDLVYKGWNALLPEGSGGYDDEERTRLTFTAPDPAPAARFMMDVPEILNVTTDVGPGEETNEGVVEENAETGVSPEENESEIHSENGDEQTEGGQTEKSSDEIPFEGEEIDDDDSPPSEVAVPQTSDTEGEMV